MEQQPHNDIDILLRKLGRQGVSQLEPNGDGSSGEKHLDADELNAYAENALPAMVRARYTDHLIECASCRKLVTQLSLASTAVIATKAEEPRPSTLKTLLASIFSPLVFRYAVPAMAILVVATIAWVALRRQAVVEQIAQNASKPEASSPATSPGFVATEQGNQTADTRRAPQAKDATAPSGETQPVAEAQTTLADKTAPEQKKAETTDEVRKRDDLAKNEQAPETNEPPPPAPASQVGSAGVASRAVAEQRVEVRQKREEMEVGRNQSVNNAEPYTAPPAAIARAKAPAKLASKEADKSAATDSASRRGAKPKDEESRTVAGHRFVREGSVWTDSRYDSSQPTTNVARGSEQYRALVADEPVIGSIAEQLDGEVIVVLKNRAYRIH